VEKDTGFKLSSLTNLKLSLHNPDMTTASRIAKAVNAYLGGTPPRRPTPPTSNWPCRQLSGRRDGAVTDIEQVKVNPISPPRW